MKKIEIKNIKGEVLFTDVFKNNTAMNTLINAVHNSANLRDVDLRGYDLTFLDFEETDCRGGDFTGADCRCADFRNGDFTGADFRGAKLRGASYTQEQIDSAITDETTIF